MKFQGLAKGHTITKDGASKIASKPDLGHKRRASADRDGRSQTTAVSSQDNTTKP